MSGNDEEREKLRPPSSLRHEILPDSTEDETMLGQSSVQESHVDNDVLDDDVITRCGFSKNRTQSDNELLNTMFLSRPGVAAGNRSPSPSVPFLFRPPPSQKNISKAGTNDNKTQKQVRFTPAGLLTPSESSIATAGSTPQAESGVVKTRGQGPVSRAGLVLIVEPTASDKNEGSRESLSVHAPVPNSKHAGQDHEGSICHADSEQNMKKSASQEVTIQTEKPNSPIDTSNAGQATTCNSTQLSAQFNDTPVIGRTQPKGPGRRGRKIRSNKNGQQQRTVWPPATALSDHSPKECVFPTPTTTQGNLEQEVREPVTLSEPETSEQKDVVSQPESQAPIVQSGIPAEENQTPDSGHARATVTLPSTKPPQHKEPPNSQVLQPRATRVHKPQKKSKVPAPSSIARANGHNPGVPFADIFEQHLQSVRVSYYAESVRNEHHYSAQIRSRDETIMELREKVKASESQIREFREKDTTREVITELQQENIKRYKNYMNGLNNDHEKLKAATKAHQQECFSILGTKVKELQQEKRALEQEKSVLEQEFFSVVEAMRSSQRSTKDALNDCFEKLKASERTRVYLVGALEAQTVRYEDERKKCEQLEQQVLTSLEAIRRHIEDDHRAMSDKLNDIDAIVTDKSADEERAAQIQECITGLDAFRQMPLATVEDARKAQDMMQSLREDLNAKIGTITTSIEENGFSGIQFQQLVKNQLESLTAQMANHGEASIELQKIQLMNDGLVRQIGAEKSKSSHLEDEMAAMRETESELRTHVARMEAELDNLKVQAAEYHAHLSKDELESDISRLREQLQQAEERVQLSTSQIKEAEMLRQSEERETVKLKDSVSRLQTELDEMKKKHSSKLKKLTQKSEEDRENLEHEYQKGLQEKDARWSSEIETLNQQKREKEELLTKTIKDLDCTREALHHAEQELRQTQSDLESAHTKLVDSDAQLINSREENVTLSSNMRDLQERFRLKDDELRRQENISATTSKKLETSQEEVTALKDSCSRYLSLLNEIKSTAKSEQDRSNETIEGQRKDLQDAREYISRLQDEIKKLEGNLETAKSNEVAISERRERLQIEIAAKDTAKQESEEKLRQLQEGAAEMSRKHEAEITSLKQQLEQSVSALEKAEAEAKRMEAVKANEMRVHRKLTKQKMREKFDEEAKANREKTDEQMQKMKDKFEEEAKAYREKIDQEKAEEVARLRQEMLANARKDEITRASPSTSNTQEAPSAMPPPAKPKRKVNRRGPSPPKTQTAKVPPAPQNIVQPEQEAPELNQEAEEYVNPSHLRSNGEPQRTSSTTVPTTLLPDTQDVHQSVNLILPETQETEVVLETQFDEHGPQFDAYMQYIPESQGSVFEVTGTTNQHPHDRASVGIVPNASDSIVQPNDPRRGTNQEHSASVIVEPNQRETHTQESGEMLFSNRPSFEALGGTLADQLEAIGGTIIRTPVDTRRAAECSPLKRMPVNSLEDESRSMEASLFQAESPCHAKSVANMSSRLAPPMTNTIPGRNGRGADNVPDATSRRDRSRPSPNSDIGSSSPDGLQMQSKGQIRVKYGRPETEFREETPSSTMEPLSQKRKVSQSDVNRSTPKRPRNAMDSPSSSARPAHQAAAAGSRIVHSSYSPSNNVSQTTGGGPTSRSTVSRRTKSSRYDLRFAAELE